MTQIYKEITPNIDQNSNLRDPQLETYAELKKFNEENDPNEREVGIILPVGCGKSGCIAIAPFAFKSKRTLVVAPSVPITKKLHEDLDPTNTNYFYKKCTILVNPPYPEPVEIRGTTTNKADLEEADVVITNIQQLQGIDNRWLQQLPGDFFDVILFDEGHHAVAESWNILKTKFHSAKIVNFSATPLRADGQIMAGRILYSYPIFRAIQKGYIKHLKAIVLNPKTLKYVRCEDGQEIEVTLDEVRRLGEEDADFRRSIVTSTETLNTIVDASIRELNKRRKESGNNNLKIIASALNFEHCRQIVEAYRARGQKSDFVHSREESKENERVMKRLENNELDVIVQVRKLGEGFDHPLLAVAAVFSIFSNLSPFVQFVGRIMRAIKQNAPGDILNQSTVIFHAGANIANRWGDFQKFTQADQEYFGQLLPLEELDFTSADELEIDPTQHLQNDDSNHVEVRSQTGVRLEEISLIKDDPEALQALQLLQTKGYTSDQVKTAFEDLEKIPVTKTKQRQAKRSTLNTRIQSEAGRILSERKINPEGRDLDLKRQGDSNFVVLTKAIHKKINESVSRKSGERHEFTRSELDQIEQNFDSIIADVISEVFHA